MQPYEVVAGPLTVWLAPVGTAAPAVNAAPSGTWFKLGTSGTKNYDEAGVVVTHTQNLVQWRPAGSTGARKVFRTSEDFMVEFTLDDLTPEQYAKALNDATVTTAAGPPAIKSINLQMGLTVAVFALLARGTSPVNDSLPAQYQVPIVYQASSPKPSYRKDGPAGLDLQYTALEDATLGFGSWIAQTA